MSDWTLSFSAQFPAAACTDAAALSAYSIQGIQPACVCTPENEAQAAEIIRFAAAHKTPVVPYGGGTSQGRCAPPPPEFLALSTKRLNKLIHHEPGDMVATVQGGMTLGDFQSAIRARGQWLPIDAPGHATVGGIVAANTFGPRSLGYGTLRDMVLGMTVINGDGLARKCGGKVVKNVTGYSLDKLYIGSMGTLGLITEVTFKLRPLPVGAEFWGIGVQNIKAGIDLLRNIASKNLPFDILQFSSFDENFVLSNNSPAIHAFACGTVAELGRINSELRATLPVECRMNHCIASVSPGKLSTVAVQMSDNVGCIGIPIVQWFKHRGKMPGATLRFGCINSVLGNALGVLSKYATAPQTVGLNGGIIDLSPLNESYAARIAAEFEKLGVNFAFENITGVHIPNRWGTPRPEWTIMRQLKAALDPAGIMNPGRFVV